MAQKVDGYGSIPLILLHNPKVSDGALEGVVEANIIGFKGTISVSTKVHHFATGNKKARIIYISPYGNFEDFIVSIKRFLVGVKFPAITNQGVHITDYVLGVLDIKSQEYTVAKTETKEAFDQGRRFIVGIACDCSDISIELDQNLNGCQLV